jgi:diketogulonate reductase-like aldo/keto reductase
MEYKTLNNGLKIPVLGFGVFQIWNEQAAETAVLEALATGYRLIDTAAVYFNEAAVGRAIKKSGIPREEITITSKMWLTDASYEGAKKAFARSLAKLETDYIDVYLLHQPYGDVYGAWHALVELYEAGKIKAIGVSNFTTDRLTDFALNQRVVPVVNQIQLHPYRQQPLSQETAKRYGIALEAWSPFNQGKEGIFQDAVLTGLAQKYQKTVAQIILRWQTQLGIITIPKSVQKTRMLENFTIFDFTLTESELAVIASLDQHPESLGQRGSQALVERLHEINPEERGNH